MLSRQLSASLRVLQPSVSFVSLFFSPLSLSLRRLASYLSTSGVPRTNAVNPFRVAEKFPRYLWLRFRFFFVPPPGNFSAPHSTSAHARRLEFSELLEEFCNLVDCPMSLWVSFRRSQSRGSSVKRDETISLNLEHCRTSTMIYITLYEKISRYLILFCCFTWSASKIRFNWIESFNFIWWVKWSFNTVIFSFFFKSWN